MTGATGEDLFRDLVETVPAVVFTARPDGSVAYMNDAFTALTGRPVSEVLDQGFIDLIHPDDVDWAMRGWLGAMASHAPFLEELRILDADGSAHWIVTHAVPRVDANGTVVAWYGAVYDVSARHAAEQILASLTDAIPQLVWTCDAAGAAIHVNRRWLEYTGIAAVELLGEGWLTAVHLDDLEETYAAWHEAIGSGTFRSRRPLRLRRHDGTYRWFMMHAVAVLGERGKPVRWYGTQTDIDDEFRASQRRALLARLGSVFAGSLDFEETAAAVVRAMCDDVADFAIVDFIGDGGALVRVAADTRRLGEEFAGLVDFAPSDAAHHPVNVVLRTGRPLIATTCDEGWKRRAAWNAEHLALLRSVRLASVAHVPMIAAGRPLGVLTFGAMESSGRAFSAADLQDAEEVAGRAAIALSNARLYADLAKSESRYRGIIDTAQEGIWILDAQARTRYVNARLATLLGYTPDQMYERPLYAFMTADTERHARHAFETQRRGGAERFEGTLVRADGALVWAIVATSPIFDAQGEFSGALGMLTDITDRKAIETQYRLLTEATPQVVWTADARGRVTFVNERWSEATGIARTAALDYGWRAAVHPDDLEQLLDGWRSARRGQSDFEAECRLRRAGDPRYRWYLVRARARRDERGRVVEWLGSTTDIDATRRLASLRGVVARAGDVLNGSLDLDSLLTRFAELLVAELADEATIEVSGGRRYVARRRELPADAPTLRAALVRRDTPLGNVILRQDGPFDGDEAGLLDELATRAAVAIENALLYEREHRVAITLQRALLPAVLPRVDGLDFDAVYHPGATEAEIGGDWYDAIALPDGRVVASIGDVTGRGLTAAVIMGRMRQAIETLATYETDPVRLLDSADAVLKRAHPDAIVTALVGLIDPKAGTLTYATAGHPTPFVRAPDGTVRRLPGRGLPLGLRDGRQPPATTLAIPPWSLLVFYTDGLIESTRDIDEGERRVVSALRDVGLAGGRAPAAELVGRVIDGPSGDDVAVMAVRVAADMVAPARPWTLGWRFDARDARRTYDVREALIEALGSFGNDVDVAAAQLVFGELIGNAVRYAPGMVDVELAWDEQSAPVLHVIDDGPGYNLCGKLPPHLAESGRGLYLISQLTRDFSVAKDARRGAHARAVLLNEGASRTG